LPEPELAKVKKVAVAYSGGLDSALCLKLLFDRYGAEEVLPVTINVGLDQQELDECRSKAELLGVKWTMQEAEDEFANEFITKAIQANASYEGYPMGTSMTRQLIARRVALFALENGCDAICEGSTGKGNDQFRMHNVFSIFAPDLTVVLPVRDFNFTRAEEKELSKQYGIPYREGIGDDRNMWSRSIGSGEVDNLKMRIAKEVYLWWVPPEDAPNQPTKVSMEFKNGIPVNCNGKTSLADMIHYLNKVGGANSIGKMDMFEDGMMGLKSREAYECPAATIILKLHKDLEQLCLTKEEVLFKPIVDAKWAELTYSAAWFHPLKEDLDAFISRSQRFVNGKYEVELIKGNIDITSRESATGLFDPQIRSLATKGFDQRDAGPAVKIHGIPYKILGKRGL